MGRNLTDEEQIERQKRMKNRHWIVEEIFKLAEEAGLSSPGWEPFAALIEKNTKQRIPNGSLKYWANGHSIPKVDEIERMAEVLGYEIDLIKIEKS